MVSQCIMLENRKGMRYKISIRFKDGKDTAFYNVSFFKIKSKKFLMLYKESADGSVEVSNIINIEATDIISISTNVPDYKN